MKKVLFIANDFPPPIKGGNMRVYKFVKFLKKQGVQVFVICNHWDIQSEIRKDPTLFQELSGVNFINVPALFRSKNLIEPSSTNRAVKSTFSVLNFVKHIISNFLFPDLYYFTWNRFAFKKSKEVIIEFQIKNVIISSPPHSSQIIGKRLKNLFDDKINWVADFRDFWSLSHDYSKRNRVLKFMVHQIEKRILSEADNVLFVSKGIKDATISRFNLKNLSRKSLVIHNGYDEEDFIDLSNQSLIDNSEINFSYLGTMFGSQTNHKLLDGIEYFKENYERGELVNFNLVGEFDTVILKKVQGLGCIKIFNKLKHKAALNFMNSSSVLILILPNDFEGSVAFSGKFFEYLKIGKPILAIVPPGEVSSIIEKFNLGEIANPDDPLNISFKMNEMISKLDSYSKMPSDEIFKYSRENLTFLLHSILI